MDLEKLSKEIDILLENETKESLTKWLNDRRKNYYKNIKKNIKKSDVNDSTHKNIINNKAQDWEGGIERYWDTW